MNVDSSQKRTSGNPDEKPNLFKFATKELSQDAFLAWFLSWAASAYREHNPKLHEAAVAFVRKLISVTDSSPVEIKTVKVRRQFENIDVWCEVNESHIILIEDKVYSGQHSNQLVRYQDFAQRWCTEHPRELVCIYIKTQSDSEANLNAVKRQGFSVFSRRELLSLLDKFQVCSDIYIDFRESLREIEIRESQFNRKRIAEWNRDDWKGFYRALEQRGLVRNWSYVPNPSGGFLAAILNWYDVNGIPLFMQIEQNKLSFKIGEVRSDRRDLRKRFHTALMKNVIPELPLERPGRFGSGAYMTVAIVRSEAWLGCANDVVDLDIVIVRLQQYQSWLEGLLGELRSMLIQRGGPADSPTVNGHSSQ